VDAAGEHGVSSGTIVVVCNFQVHQEDAAEGSAGDVGGEMDQITGICICFNDRTHQ
jgi:hypothetical protein